MWLLCIHLIRNTTEGNEPLGQDFIGAENICTVLKTYIYLSI